MNIVAILGVLILVGLAAWFLTREEPIPPAGILLYADGPKDDGNEVVYTGVGQKAKEAFSSILAYLVISYHLDPETGSWRLVGADMMMVPGDTYWIKVSQDCTWTF